jgi:hypothetical protein
MKSCLYHHQEFLPVPDQELKPVPAPGTPVCTCIRNSCPYLRQEFMPVSVSGTDACSCCTRNSCLYLRPEVVAVYLRQEFMPVSSLVTHACNCTRNYACTCTGNSCLYLYWVLQPLKMQGRQCPMDYSKELNTQPT